MNKRFSLAVLVLSVSISAHAQIKWPAITPVSKPFTRWWWMGSAVNKKDLTANMEKYVTAGLGGLEITPIYGVAGYEKQFVDYLSPQWMQLFGHTLQEAKRLHLVIDMATGSGWPFGGGPLIGDEYACKNFEYKTWSLKAGETLQEPVTFTQEPYAAAEGNHVHALKTIPVENLDEAKADAHVTDAGKLVDPVYANKNLQALALDQVKFKKALPLQVVMAYGDNGQAIELTGKVDAAGKLNWTAPAGNWTVYALFMGYHGKMVERAAPGAEGNAIDHFSKAALNVYLSRFDKAFTGYDLSALRGFFNDSYEVDDVRRGQSNYTPRFFDAFKRLRGYDLKLHLHELLKQNPDETSLRILFDYRQTIADLLLEQFTIPWHNWAQAKGKIVRNQSHGSPANIIDLYGAVDIPETEGTELLRFKFAASAAHVLGKPLASAEAATWLNEHFKSSLGDVKKAVDNYFIGGVNHIVYHGTNYSPENEPWPGWLFYAAVHFQPVNPLWKDFGKLNQYVTRCQSFLQSGKPDNDILLYFPFSDHNSEPARGLLQHYDGMKGMEHTDFNTVAEELLQKGYAFDLISDNQLQQVQNNGTFLKVPGGTYKTIVIANAKYLPLPTLQKLMTLAKNGATIIVYKNLPSGVPGYGGYAEKQKQFDVLTASLKFESDGKIMKAKTGNGAFVKGDDVLELLTAGHTGRETMFDKGLQCIRRNTAGGKYYFITNTGSQAVNEFVPLATSCSSVVWFDAMHAKSGLASMQKSANGNIEVYLSLQPGESCILQTSSTAIQGTPYPFYTAAGNAIPVQGTWNLQFTEGGPSLPHSTTITEPGSWTGLPDSAASIFSGTAQYSIHFTKPAGDAKAWKLNLGNVALSAEIILNGKVIDTLIGPFYETIIPAAALQANNLLEIKVTNGMANRIIDMDKRGVEWKKFYNIDFPAHVPANRGADGLFTAARWQPEPSGLLGPVTLTPLTLMK